LDPHQTLYEKSIAKKQKIANIMKAETEKINENTNKEKKSEKNRFLLGANKRKKI